MLALSLFVLFSWFIISIFFLIPKSMSKIENIILFFCFTIAILNTFTILELNLKLIRHSTNTELFIGLLLQRNVIAPLCFLIFINLFMLYQSKFIKLSILTVTIMVLLFSELLTVWTGIKTYRGWNNYLTLVAISVHMILYVFLTTLIRKIPERKFK